MDVLTAVLAAGVAAGYYTIAALIVPKIVLTNATPRFVTAFRVGGIAFFVGCGLTHTHIAYHAIVDATDVGAHEAAFHLLQVFGVWIFIYAAVRFLEVRVQRRRTPAEELRARVEELSRSNDDLERFAHVVAHDLRDPLTSISGFATLLERDAEQKLDEDAATRLRFIREGALRMEQLLDGVLAYSRVAGAGLDRESVPLDEVVREAQDALRGLIDERRAEITADELPVVEGDRVQLRQLLQNLLSNAIKFADRDRPRVHVSAQESEDRTVTVSVADNGVGIDSRDRDRVFQIFRRGRRTADQPGTGVGLALCAKIVDRHGGRLWFEDAAGGGTVFKFTALRRPGSPDDGAARTMAPREAMAG
jgi:signal transduction histidine kinase